MKHRSFILLFCCCFLVFNLPGQDVMQYSQSADASAAIVPAYLSDYGQNVTGFAVQMSYTSSRYASYLSENKKDASVWLSYYKSLRYCYESGGAVGMNKAALDTVDAQMKRNVPGTYQQEFVRYWNSGHDQQFYPGLLRAYTADNSDPEILRQMIGAQIVKGDIKSAAKYCAEWKNTGDMPQSIIDYAYDVLQSCAENAVLITNGEFDTYPIIYWQEKMKVRMDVKLLPLNLIDRSDDRAAIFRDIGISLPSNDSVSVFNTDYFKRVAAANATKKFYFASTLPSSWMNAMSGDLYVCGLAMRYGADEVDNLQFLKNNVGTKMDFTLLNSSYSDSKNNFDQNFSTSLQMNYVLPLAMAAQQYDIEGSKKKAEELRVMARKIGVANNRATEVEQIINNNQ